MIFYIKNFQYAGSEIAEILKVQSVVRLFSYGFLLLFFLIRLAYGMFLVSPAPLIYLSFLSLSLSALSFLISKKDINQSIHTSLIRVLPIIDVILISFIVYYSSGIESKMVFLYIIPCLSLVMFSIRDLIKIGLFSLSAYALTMVADYYDFFGEVITSASYEVKQLAIINMMRMGLIISVVTVMASFFIIYIVRVISRHIDKKEETLFSIAEILGEPLEQTSILLDQIKSGQEISPKILNDIKVLISRVDDSLKEKNILIEKARESAPICCKLNFSTSIVCGMCHKKIGLARRFWSIPKGFRAAFNYGEHANEIHCHSCHKKGGENCEYCEAWK